MSNQESWMPTEKNIEDYNLLKELLLSQRKEFDLLSKKKADGQLNPMKIKMINRVLKPLNDILSHGESHTFLDILNEDDIPTYSDVVLVISQYETAIRDFKSRYFFKDYYLNDKYKKYTERWMTQEEPLDYWASQSDEGEADREE
jgi:hypothetical protein